MSITKQFIQDSTKEMLNTYGRISETHFRVIVGMVIHGTPGNEWVFATPSTMWRGIASRGA